MTFTNKIVYHFRLAVACSKMKDCCQSNNSGNTKGALLLLFTMLLPGVGICNNITVSSVSLPSPNPNAASHFTKVKFTVAWDNSWRTDVGPSNWDAAWVFVKYRLKSTTVWNHATLNWVDGSGNGDGHTVPAGAIISSSNDTGIGGSKGIFVYASGNMAQGPVNYVDIELQWNYGDDGLGDSDAVEIAVFAIEMVYIPQGAFYVGDGNAASVAGQFRVQATNSPYQITSEGAITLGGGGATDLHNNNTTGQTGGADDFNDATSQSLPAVFPKGFSAFYIMKYEASQEQYAEFLNKLDRVQQAARIATTTVGNYMHVSGTQTNPVNRNGVKLMSDPVLTPRIYGNDLNNNGVAGEIGDGQNIACNWISTPDAMAYLDWAGLRPFTELEYEKACRGPLVPVAGEHAWGGITYLNATAISNSGQGDEIANAGANIVYNAAAGVQGPMRVGSFAQAATTRIFAGATYYGVMEMSGNAWEYTVGVGTVTGRTFTGSHGDGILSASGNRTNADWPNTTTGVGYNLRGGSWGNTTPVNVPTVSGRINASWAGVASRYGSTSCRGVRTAP